jgi:hypothetical protein
LYILVLFFKSVAIRFFIFQFCLVTLRLRVLFRRGRWDGVSRVCNAKKIYTRYYFFNCRKQTFKLFLRDLYEIFATALLSSGFSKNSLLIWRRKIFILIEKIRFSWFLCNDLLYIYLILFFPNIL